MFKLKIIDYKKELDFSFWKYGRVNILEIFPVQHS